MNVDLDEAEVINTLICIRCMWKNGEVKDEAIGSTLAGMRHKFEEALKAINASPPSTKKAE